MKGNGVSVLMAAWNEKDSVRPVCRKVVDVMTRHGEPYEIILVDDGSIDGTGDHARQEKVTVISHPYNKGYGASLKTAARASRYSCLALIDPDGQHDPEDLPRLLEKFETGDFDMVVGSRSKASASQLTRRPGKRLLSWTANYLSGTNIPDLNSGLRILRKDRFLEFIHILPNQFSLTTTLTLSFLMDGYSVGYIPIIARKRVGRHSNVKVVRDGYLAILTIINTIVLFNPNKVFIPAALLLFSLGLLYSGYSIIKTFNIPSGALLLLLTSVIVFFFGIIADQISAIRRERK